MGIRIPVCILISALSLCGCCRKPSEQINQFSPVVARYFNQSGEMIYERKLYPGAIWNFKGIERVVVTTNETGELNIETYTHK